jgi:hypothetical protein
MTAAPTGVACPNMGSEDYRILFEKPSSWKQNDNGSLLVKTGVGTLRTIMVTAASGTPTLKIYDGLDNGGTVMVKIFTPVAGTQYRFDNAYFATGLYLEIGGTTVDFTVTYT